VDGWTARPARADVVLSLRWAALLTALFFSVYGLCNWLASQRAARHRLWFDWEISIPFMPGMVWVYLSLFLLFFLPMFALRAPALDALCRRLALAVVLSGLVFLLLPAEAGFTRPVDASKHSIALQLVHTLDLPHNLVPSLHVSWSALFVLALRRPSPAWLRRAFELWFAALCASVLLVHQHHLIDIVSGLLVAWLVHAAVREDGSWAVTSGRKQ
jgi:PAP2 superfamily